MLLDQRGTGRSTPVLAQTLAARGSPEAQADYLKHFRYECERVGIRGVHGHLHFYAQARYQELDC